jgi:hypothetical protein
VSLGWHHVNPFSQRARASLLYQVGDLAKLLLLPSTGLAHAPMGELPPPPSLLRGRQLLPRVSLPLRVTAGELARWRSPLPPVACAPSLFPSGGGDSPVSQSKLIGSFFTWTAEDFFFPMRRVFSWYGVVCNRNHPDFLILYLLVSHKVSI